MKRRLVAVVATFLAVATAAVAAGPELKSEQDKTLYAIGLALSRNLSGFELTESELKLVEMGMQDGVLNRKAQVELKDYSPKIQELSKERATAASAKEKERSKAFLEKAAAEKGAKKMPSGLIIQETKAGTGPSPKATDKVKVHYHGTLIDGTVFDSSVDRGQPATFPLNGVIPCWTEGVQQMKVGGKSKLICPSDIAYGDRGSPPKIKPGAALVFDVELIEIVDSAPPPAAPAAPAAPEKK